jgi:hypothetical protein
MKLRLLLAAAVLLPLVAARAELPPSAYRAMQERAPEVLEIKVDSVVSKETKEKNYTETHQTVTATVQQVERSSTKLELGATIRIVYTQRRHKQPMAGPSSVPTLKQGKVYPAFLRADKETGSYSPAAGGYSFERVDGRD